MFAYKVAPYFILFLVLICLRCSGKQDNSLFDQVGLVLLSKPPNYEGCPSKSWTFVIARDFVSGIL